MEVLGSRILVGTRIRGNDAADDASGALDSWQVFTVAAWQIVEIVGYDSRSEALAKASAARCVSSERSDPERAEGYGRS